VFYALIRKDLRMLRPAIVAAVLLFAFLEIVVAIAATYAEYRQLRAIHVPYDALYVWRSIALRAYLALGLSCGLAAIFAGAGRPIERRERWADLAAMLPVSRLRQTLARLAVAGGLTLAICGCHVLLVWAANARVPSPADPWRPGARWRLVDDRAVWDVLPFAFAMFGLAWLGAAFMRSAAINVVVSIMLVLAAHILVNEWLTSRGLLAEAYFRGFVRALLVVGAVSLVAGTVVSARRVEP
jgi:hypothetical protein